MSYLPIIATEMILASTVAIVLYWWDKRAAKKNESARMDRKHDRIAERTLLLVSLLGGWPGAWWASQRFRHKTKKVSFRLRFWTAVSVHIAVIAAVLWWA